MLTSRLDALYSNKRGKKGIMPARQQHIPECVQRPGRSKGTPLCCRSWTHGSRTSALGQQCSLAQFHIWFLIYPMAQRNTISWTWIYKSQKTHNGRRTNKEHHGNQGSQKYIFVWMVTFIILNTIMSPVVPGSNGFICSRSEYRDR